MGPRAPLERMVREGFCRASARASRPEWPGSWLGTVLGKWPREGTRCTHKGPVAPRGGRVRGLERASQGEASCCPHHAPCPLPPHTWHQALALLTWGVSKLLGDSSRPCSSPEGRLPAPRQAEPRQQLPAASQQLPAASQHLGLHVLSSARARSSRGAGCVQQGACPSLSALGPPRKRTEATRSLELPIGLSKAPVLR